MKLKKYLVVISVIILLISLCACGKRNVDGSTNPTLSDEQINVTAPSMDDHVDPNVWEDVIGYEIVLDEYLTNVRIAVGGEYNIVGSMTNKMLIIDTTEDVVLNLNNVTIENQNGPCIYFKSESMATVVLAENSNNMLISTGNSDYETLNAAIYSNASLCFDGKGMLSVVCTYGHAIKSTDLLDVFDGTYVIASFKNCMYAQDFLWIENGAFDLTSTEGDALEADGEIVIHDGQLKVNVGGDGIKSDFYVEIMNGMFEIRQAKEGIESKGDMVINGGQFTINTIDDCINAIGCLTINGGEITAISATNDALDGNEGIIINGGKIYAIGTAEHEGAFDCDDAQLIINGGTLIGVGETNSEIIEGEQRGIVINVNNDEIVNIVEIKTMDGSLAYSCSIPTYDAPHAPGDNTDDEKESSSNLPVGNNPGKGPGSQDDPSDTVVGNDSMLYVSIFISHESLVSGTYDVYLNGRPFGTITI